MRFKHDSINLDTGVFPKVNYNRVVASGKKAVTHIPTVPITSKQVMGIYKVSQNLNDIVQPDLAIKGKVFGQKREGLI